MKGGMERRQSRRCRRDGMRDCAKVTTACYYDHRGNDDDPPPRHGDFFGGGVSLFFFFLFVVVRCSFVALVAIVVFRKRLSLKKRAGRSRPTRVVSY